MCQLMQQFSTGLRRDEFLGDKLLGCQQNFTCGSSACSVLKMQALYCLGKCMIIVTIAVLEQIQMKS